MNFLRKWWMLLKEKSRRDDNPTYFDTLFYGTKGYVEFYQTYKNDNDK